MIRTGMIIQRAEGALFFGISLCVCIVLLSACSRPVAQFTLTHDEVPRAPATISVNNQSENAEEYLWIIPGKDTVREAEPTFRIMQSGDYEITLIARQGNKMRSKTMELKVSPPEKCLIIIETPFGNMMAELYDETPQHRDNFLKLTEEGFFDGLLFHRVINGFMIQGGDPDSRAASAGQRLGMGGPGYTVPAEFVDTLVHLKGALSAARQADQVNPQRASSGSQFYIVQGRPADEAMLQRFAMQKGSPYTEQQIKAYAEVGGTPFLDGQYTVFGRIIEGLEIIDKIAEVETDAADRPKEDVRMRIIAVK